jgi:hypothetical protein
MLVRMYLSLDLSLNKHVFQHYDSFKITKIEE